MSEKNINPKIEDSRFKTSEEFQEISPITKKHIQAILIKYLDPENKVDWILQHGQEISDFINDSSGLTEQEILDALFIKYDKQDLIGKVNFAEQKEILLNQYIRPRVHRG